MRRSFLSLAGGALALSLFIAACGDDGDDSTADEPTTAETEMTGSGDAEADADIVDTAVEAGDFSTLVATVQAAGLEETLRGDGPYTVFAPTDAAFEALPPGTVDALLADPDGTLTDILAYHVVEGEFLAADVAELDGQEVTTVNGATFTVNVADDGSVTLTDGAGNEVVVSQTDIATSNGVIHVVNAVLMPS